MPVCISFKYSIWREKIILILHLETNNIIKHLQVEKAPILCFSFEHYGPNVANIGWVQKKKIYSSCMLLILLVLFSKIVCSQFISISNANKYLLWNCPLMLVSEFLQASYIVTWDRTPPTNAYGIHVFFFLNFALNTKTNTLVNLSSLASPWKCLHFYPD